MAAAEMDVANSLDHIRFTITGPWNGAQASSKKSVAPLRDRPTIAAWVAFRPRNGVWHMASRREALAILTATALLTRRVSAAERRFFRLATGSTGGTYYPIGALIAEAISAPPGARPCVERGPCGVPGLIASSLATAGSVANIGLIQTGAVESGFVQGDIAAMAYLGQGGWTGRPAGELRAIANLYPETLHLITRREAGITRLGDLIGKRVSLDEQGSGTLTDASLILASVDITPDMLESVNLPVGEAVRAMLSDQLDAFFFLGGHPADRISELASQMPIEILPIEGTVAARIVAEHPFLSATVLPAGTYPGQTTPVPTLSVGAQWLTSARQPAALIRDITAALWSPATARLLRGGPRQGRSIALATALDGISVPLHPGAAEYYKEISILK